MAKNILIIDDSALMRRVLSDIISKDGRFKVSAEATNGLEGLSLIEERGKEFDAVLLDINMPRMNGLELLAELKLRNMKLKVIIVSTMAKRDAKETIRALELGAFDFVTKPESFTEVKSNQFSDRLLLCLAAATDAQGIQEQAQAQVQDTISSIMNNIKATLAVVSDMEKKASKTNDQPGRPSQGPADSSKKGAAKESAVVQEKEEALQGQDTVKETVALPRKKKQVNTGRGKLVALACSTGGPKALHTVIPGLPADLDAAVLVVQHMPGGFTKSLADRLNELSKIRVKEAEDGDRLVKGTVYIAKGGHQMRLKRGEDGSYFLTVTKEPARHGLLPCADIMYESLLDSDFEEITCVVLTGMGGDGTAGISQLYKKHNIHVIAQNEETCIVYGMPKVVKEAGLVDEVVGLSEVSDAIIRNVYKR